MDGPPSDIFAEENGEREILQRLQFAAITRLAAIKDYGEAIREAAASGLSNTRIAREVGVTETAIRLYRKRHGL